MSEHDTTDAPEPVAPFNLPLEPQHVRLLVDSAIKPEVAQARGYRTITMRQDLASMGFAPQQQIVPGLLLPSFDVHGQPSTPEYRPDVPRLNKDSKPVKYERPKGSQMDIDVPKAALSKLGDPQVPLVITEGVRKADSAVSFGLSCIALHGVWGYTRETLAYYAESTDPKAVIGLFESVGCHNDIEAVRFILRHDELVP